MLPPQKSRNAARLSIQERLLQNPRGGGSWQWQKYKIKTKIDMRPETSSPLTILSLYTNGWAHLRHTVMRNNFTHPERATLIPAMLCAQPNYFGIFVAFPSVLLLSVLLPIIVPRKGGIMISGWAPVLQGKSNYETAFYLNADS